jgi:hypothetical protein
MGTLLTTIFALRPFVDYIKKADAGFAVDQRSWLGCAIESWSLILLDSLLYLEMPM